MRETTNFIEPIPNFLLLVRETHRDWNAVPIALVVALLDAQWALPMDNIRSKRFPEHV